MSSVCPPIALIVRPGDRTMFVGRDEMGRRSAMVWVVFHAGDGGWTHLYRVEDRAPRCVHLIGYGEGDVRAALAERARRTLGLTRERSGSIAA